MRNKFLSGTRPWMALLAATVFLFVAGHAAAHSLPPEILAKLSVGAGDSGAQGQPILISPFQLTAATYVILGFEHILPLGLDHILFILGLFLLSREVKPLILQVSAFTVAHTLTLGMTMYGVISPPARIVEPLIALSICYIAVENILTSELKPWRPVVIFGFGLLHGMGFAGVLGELGMPEDSFLNALISFNIGVELGQLFVIGVAYVCLRLLYAFPWYRPFVVEPASLAIAAIGAYWTVERVLA